MNELDRREFESRHTTDQIRTVLKTVYQHQCAICGGIRALSVHHWWHPYKTCKNFACVTAIANLVLVCRACHRALHAMTLEKARAKLMPYVAVKLKTSPQDLRLILEGHCSRRHVLDYLLIEH